MLRVTESYHFFQFNFTQVGFFGFHRAVTVISINIHRYTPQMVWVLGGHADPQCIENTLGVGEGERARW